MIFTGILSRCRSHTGLKQKKDTVDFKHAKYHMNIEPLFGPAGDSGSIDNYIIEKI